MNEATVQKIKPAFEDERGAIFDLLDDENILHIGVITCTKGAVRGNHYHNKAKQFNYILKGKFEFVTRGIDESDPVKTVIVEEGDFVSIPTHLIHTFVALEDGEFMDFNTESRSGDGYESDTVRIKIV